jgi:thiosulfate dehydrogenase
MNKLLKLMAVSLLLMSTASTYAAGVDGFEGTWVKPDESTIPANALGDQIRYGRELVTNSYKTMGGGSNFMPPYTGNKLSCSNCHMDNGTAAYAGPWSIVALKYADPGIYSAREQLYRNRQLRINGCMERSMDGVALPYDGPEMLSILAYFDWLATGMKVTNHTLVKGTGFLNVPDLTRAADPVKGKEIYKEKCEACHQEDGNGVWDPDAQKYIYPAIFGQNSFNDGAGMYRLRTGVTFVYSNMPYGRADASTAAVLKDVSSLLSQADAWDVTAYIMSQPRPVFYNQLNDWGLLLGPDKLPNYLKKVADADYPHLYPRANYADNICAPPDLSSPPLFAKSLHKYGPWTSINAVLNKWIADYKALCIVP